MTSGHTIPQETGIVVAVIADYHNGQSFHTDRNDTCLEWAASQHIIPDVLLDLGDSNGTVFRDRLRAEFPQYANTRYLKVLGNHDADAPIDSEPGTVGPDPFSECIAAFPDVFTDGKEYWRHNVTTRAGNATHVDILGLQNITDYVKADGQNAYRNCNPPGWMTQQNPDHTGLLDPDSPQRQWIAQQLATIGDKWMIVSAHRGWMTEFDTDPRREAWETRFLLPMFEAAGVSAVWTGDKHVGSIARIGQVDYMGLAGGYFVRPIGGNVVAPESLLWTSGSSTPSSGLCHIAYIEFNNDTASRKVFECSNADPVGSVVYTDTFTRNGGVAGALMSS